MVDNFWKHLHNNWNLVLGNRDYYNMIKNIAIQKYFPKASVMNAN